MSRVRSLHYINRHKHPPTPVHEDKENKQNAVKTVTKIVESRLKKTFNPLKQEHSPSPAFRVYQKRIQGDNSPLNQQ